MSPYFLLLVIMRVSASQPCDAQGQENASNAEESIAAFDLTQILKAVELKCNYSAPTTSCAPLMKNYTTGITFVTATHHKYYDTEFKLHSRYCLAGHNIAVYLDMSLSDCAYLCVRNNACAAFNYFNSRKCELKYAVSLVTFRLSTMSAHDCDFLYKDCAQVKNYQANYLEQTYYHFTNFALDFHESTRACRNMGMALMEVGDYTEFSSSLVLAQMKKQPTWSWLNAVQLINGSSTTRVWEVSRAAVILTFRSDRTETTNRVNGYPVATAYYSDSYPYDVAAFPPSTKLQTICQCNEYSKVL